MAPTPPMAGSPSRSPTVTGDRLSSLPDTPLHTIMSFLPARQAVQTCVLSWRWRDLWCSMPCLNIDQREFDTAASPVRREDLERARDRFKKFVDRLLTLHSADTLDTLRFHATGYEFKVVDQWLRRSIKGSPVVVEISLSNHAIFHGLPHYGSSYCRLKRLRLVSVALGASLTQQICSDCPVLEDLELESCLLDSSEVASCTLKSLVIMDCAPYYDTNVVVVKAPALTSFHLSLTVVGLKWQGVLVNKMPSLVKASICFRTGSGTDECSIQKKPCKLLCSLTNARELELSGSVTLSLLQKRSDDFPTFYNLRTLLFDGCDSSDTFQILGCFLNNAPMLEKLTLQFCKLPEGSRKRTRTGTKKPIFFKCDKLTFHCPNLKLTEIKYREDDVQPLFGLLMGIWSSLRNTTIVLTKV
ncbi:hypothetical protein EJB05_37831 [Eragrostis curvula]|uniref:Uncharacterized protein n=1 Tax=Eragrostis curvula TaxID=38414 RepID=A0A5J9TU69_9POAL|nr:hypothetical protein EJB05_37831 [Eragrostis curvula]